MKRIIKKKTCFSMPVWLVLVAAVVVIAVTVNFFPDTQTNQNKFFYIASALAMPDGAEYAFSEIIKDTGKLFSIIKNDSNLSQKIGSYNETSEEKITSPPVDIIGTPDDILKSSKKYLNDVANGVYKEDGDVNEQTFINDGATDSFENIYIKNVTDAQSISVEDIVKNSIALPIDDFSEMTVLIYHTHSTETYIMADDGKFSSAYSSRNTDKSVNMVRIGDEITRILEENGIGVIHDREIHDEKYTGAYAVSRACVEEYLKENPSIIITLDIHRDAIYYDDYTRIKQVCEVNGKKAAQMMIIAGAEGGNVEYFPTWKTNLSFAVMLQKYANGMYDGLMKPIYFCNRKYNMDMTPFSLLIEVGTDVNTLDEAAYSGRLLGNALSGFIKEYGK